MRAARSKVSATVVELLTEARALIERQPWSGRNSGREFTLAVKALEDAKMRYVRGRCMQLGTFNDSFDPDAASSS